MLDNQSESSESAISDDEPADHFLPPGIHNVFPSFAAPNSTYIFRLREKIRSHLAGNCASMVLCLMVSKKLNGTDAKSRLRNLIDNRTLTNQNDKVFVPMLLYSFNLHQIDYKLRSRRKLRMFSNMYDFLVVQLIDRLSLQRHELSLRNTRSQFVNWMVKLLLASRQNPKSMQNVTFSFVNTRSTMEFWNRFINCIVIEDVIREAKQTITGKRFILCPNGACVGMGCRAFFHLRDFEQVEINNPSPHDTAIDKSQSFMDDPDEEYFIYDESEEQLDNPSMPLYNFRPFQFGLQTSSAYESFNSFQDQDDRVVGIITNLVASNLHSSLLGYQILCSKGCTYVVGGMHIPAGQELAATLSLDAITSDRKFFIYVGRSRNMGINTYHMDQFAQSSFSKAIKDLKLNCFWELKCNTDQSALESEKQEAVCQLYFRHANRFSPNRNIVLCNEHVEISSLDICSDVELRKIVEVLDNRNLTMICNVVREIPNFNPTSYGDSMFPIELCKAKKIAKSF